jgi:signal peptidase II
MDAISGEDGKNQKQKNNERKLKRSFVFCLAVVLGVVWDQYIKHLVFLNTNLPKFLVHFKNYKFAFSLPLPVWLIFVLYGLVLTAAVRYFLKRFTFAQNLELLGWVLLFSGALSNVGERLVLGYVRDYFRIFNGIFNLADLFIMLGILLLMVKTESPKPKD